MLFAVMCATVPLVHVSVSVRMTASVPLIKPATQPVVAAWRCTAPYVSSTRTAARSLSSTATPLNSPVITSCGREGPATNKTVVRSYFTVVFCLFMVETVVVITFNFNAFPVSQILE